MRVRRASKVASASSKRLSDRYSIASPYQTKGSSFPPDVIFTRNSRRLLLEGTLEPLAHGLDAVSWRHAVVPLLRRRKSRFGEERALRGVRRDGGERPPCRRPAREARARGPAPDFQLDVPKRPPPKPIAPRKVEAEVKLELAVEPRNFLRARVVDRTRGLERGLEPHHGRPAGAGLIDRAQARAELGPTVGDVAFDAQLLADYGPAPSHWLLSPLYAWRVLRRQRELRKGLAGRREEAKRAAHEVEDALVAFAERTRPVAEKQSDFARTIEELRGAEDVLRSRDRVLASEQDAQSARLAAVDARLAKLEAELAHAQAAERTIAGELASAQAGLARGESKLKRAESELRSAQQREADGSHG